MPDERLPFVRHYFLGHGLCAVCKNVKCRGFVLYVATAFDIGLHDYGIIAFIICYYCPLNMFKALFLLLLIDDKPLSFQ